MSIQKRENGMYRARVRGLDGKEIARHFAKRSEAARWEAEQKTQLARGEYVDQSNKLTFLGFFDEWAPRQVWETNTARNLTMIASQTTFGLLPMVKIRRSHVEEWVKKMQKDGLAPGTIKSRMVNMRSVFRAAVRELIIAKNPAEGVVLPRQRRREMSIVLATPKQVGRILECSAPHVRAMFAIAAFGGLRFGEVTALRVCDVDFDERVIRVTRQVQRAMAGELEIRLPKYGSERVVYMADGLADIMRDHIKRFEMSGLQWLFPGENDRPLHHNSVDYLWRRACRLAGVEKVRLHDMRHYFASSLIDAGCDVVQVQRALGHASATTTLACYAHMFPSAENKVRAAAEAMINRTRGEDGLTADHDLAA